MGSSKKWLPPPPSANTTGGRLNVGESYNDSSPSPIGENYSPFSGFSSSYNNGAGTYQNMPDANTANKMNNRMSAFSSGYNPFFLRM